MLLVQTGSDNFSPKPLSNPSAVTSPELYLEAAHIRLTFDARDASRHWLLLGSDPGPGESQCLVMA